VLLETVITMMLLVREIEALSLVSKFLGLEAGQGPRSSLYQISEICLADPTSFTNIAQQTTNFMYKATLNSLEDETSSMAPPEKTRGHTDKSSSHSPQHQYQ
jgi:hypothetical protein